MPAPTNAVIREFATCVPRTQTSEPGDLGMLVSIQNYWIS